MNILSRLRLILPIAVNEMLPSATGTGRLRDSSQPGVTPMTPKKRLQTVHK